MEEKIIEQEKTIKLMQENENSAIKIMKMYEEEKNENDRLKELCNKYEEEHNTTFKQWQEDIKKINKAVECLKEIRQSTFTKYNSNEWNNCLSYNDDLLPLLNILEGRDK